MKSASWSRWTALGAHTRDLSLRRTLLSGQAFRWRERRASEWVGVLGRTAYALRENGDNIDFAYYCHPDRSPSLSEQEAKARLRDYFHLDKVSLPEYYERWAMAPTAAPLITPSVNASKAADINKAFKSVSLLLPGLRLLRQDPEECLFAFICSQNNNVKRISSMVDSLATTFGDVLCEDDGVTLCAFPTVERIATITEQQLRELGFGYRAKYIPRAAQQVLEKEKRKPNWLRDMRVQPRDQVVDELQELTGVGPKVADCVSLFSLDKVDLVPVDTHVWQITQRFMPALRGKTLSPALYKSVGSFWREKFGEWAGWAHTVMFAAELGEFKEELQRAAPELMVEKTRANKQKKSKRDEQTGERKTKRRRAKSESDE